jgi:hypothetical protein
VKEIVSDAAPIFEILTPPGVKSERKMEGLVVSLIAVLPTALLKLAKLGFPFIVG